jgi:hypothetical protein
LASELCQIVGDELFFTWYIFLEVGKTQDLPSKIWQTLGDEPMQQFGKLSWHPSNFGKIRKISLQQFGKPTWRK